MDGVESGAQGGRVSASALDLGCYEAARAAALAGLPVSTLYEWSRTGLVTPSASPTRTMLWSFADLLKLRLVRWLRTDKPDAARTSMAEVRRAIDELGDDLWDEHDGVVQPSIRVVRDGHLVRVDLTPATLDGQLVLDGIDLLVPGGGAIDLRRPRPRLRIHPGRVSGEPHLVHSRLTTRAVAGLARRGLSLDRIAELYPDDDPHGLVEAIDFEAQLESAAAA